jgi:hypothetical protein
MGSVSFSGRECIVRKPKGKRPVAKPRHRWEANIETDLKTGYSSGMDSFF